MTAPHTSVTRSRPVLRIVAASAATAVASLVLPLAGGAAAQSISGPIDLQPTCPVAAPPAPIDDRDQVAEVHLPNVDCSFALDIARGSGGSFMPSQATRRDQMASLIVRTLEAAGYTLPAGGGSGFGDIEGNEHRAAIEQLAAIGVVQGTSSTTYSPAQLVRRDQMASFVWRAAEWAFGGELEAVEGPHFADVPPTNVHQQNVDAAYELLGIVRGSTAGLYQPSQPIRRDQMASFMLRLVDVTRITE